MVLVHTLRYLLVTSEELADSLKTHTLKKMTLKTSIVEMPRRISGQWLLILPPLVAWRARRAVHDPGAR